MTRSRKASAAEHAVRQRARARAAAWLARAHPQPYRVCYQQALAQARAQGRGLTTSQMHQQASRQARAALQACFPDEYAARYQAELTAIQPVEPVLVGEVDREEAARARVRALVWLAGLHPDLARQRLSTEAARLPLHPADRTPVRRWKLALVRALDGLRAVFPEQFQARYTAELAGQAGTVPRHDQKRQAWVWVGPSAADRGVDGSIRPSRREGGGCQADLTGS